MSADLGKKDGKVVGRLCVLEYSSCNMNLIDYLVVLGNYRCLLVFSSFKAELCERKPIITNTKILPPYANSSINGSTFVMSRITAVLYVWLALYL